MLPQKRNLTLGVCMVRLAVEELIERLDIAAEVLKDSDKAGVETLVEAVLLAKNILQHYVTPFSFQGKDMIALASLMEKLMREHQKLVKEMEKKQK